MRITKLDALVFMAVLFTLPVLVGLVVTAVSGGTEYNIVDIWVPSRLYGQLGVWMAPLNTSAPGLVTTTNVYVIDEKGQAYYSYLFSNTPPLMVWVDPTVSARSYSIMYGGGNPYSGYTATPGGSIPLFAGWDDFDYDSGFWTYIGHHSITGSQLLLENATALLNTTYTPGVIALWLVRYGAYGTQIQLYSPNGYVGWIHIRLTDANFQDWGSIRDGTDIYFTDSTGLPLYYSLPHVDLQNHIIDALINVNLTAGAGATIYMHYGGNNPYVDHQVPLITQPAYAEATPYPLTTTTQQAHTITGYTPRNMTWTTINQTLTLNPGDKILPHLYTLYYPDSNSGSYVYVSGLNFIDYTIASSIILKENQYTNSNYEHYIVRGATFRLRGVGVEPQKYVLDIHNTTWVSYAMADKIYTNVEYDILVSFRNGTNGAVFFSINTSNATYNGVFRSLANSYVYIGIYTTSIPLGWNGYIKYLAIWNVYDPIEGKNTFSYKIDKTNLVLLLDPTFFNGTHYLDPFNNYTGTPYGDVERVPDNKTWLWVVENVSDNGLVYFDWVPYGSLIRIYDSSNTLVATVFAVGPADTSGFVHDIGVPLPPGNYTIVMNTWVYRGGVENQGLYLVRLLNNALGLSTGSSLLTSDAGSLWVEYADPDNVVAWYGPGYSGNLPVYTTSRSGATPFFYWNDFSDTYSLTPIAFPFQPFSGKTLEADVSVDWFTTQTLSNIVLKGNSTVLVHLYDWHGSGDNVEVSGNAYRTPVTIVNNVSQALTNYAVKITLDASNFDGWNSINSSNVYFTDPGGNPLYYWVETMDTANMVATIWVKVPSIPAYGSGSTMIYMYYGGSNPYASYNDPTRVFTLYDDFSDASLSSTWTATDPTKVTVANGTLDIDGGGSSRVLVTTSVSLTGDYIVETRVQAKSTYTTFINWLTVGFMNSQVYVGGLGAVGAGYLKHYNLTVDLATLTTINSVAQSLQANTWYVHGVWVQGDLASGTVTLHTFLNGVYVFNATITGTGWNTTIGLGVNKAEALFDWVRVRPFVYPEPSVAIGTSQATGYTLNGLVSMIVNETIYTPSNLSSLPAIIDASKLTVFLDPTLYNGTHYIDPATGRTAQTNATRLETTTPRITILENTDTDGKIHFRYLPPGTKITITDTTTSITWTYYILGTPLDTGLVPDYAITPPTANPIDITIQIPGKTTILPHLYTAHFNGKDGYIQLNNQISVTNLTILTQIKPKYPFTYLYADFIWKVNSFVLRLFNNGLVRLYTFINGTAYETTSLRTITGTTKLAVVYNGQTGGALIYINGTIDVTNTLPSGGLDTSSYYLSIGSRYNDPTLHPYNGFITYIILYDKVLENIEIDTVQEAYIVESNKLAYFFDPTFFNGTHYIDPLNGFVGTPYGGVKRVPDNSTWLWVVGGRVGEGDGVGRIGLVLSWIPVWSYIRVYNSTGGLVWEGYASGPVNKVGYVTEMTIPLPPGNYKVQVQLPKPYIKLETTTGIQANTTIAPHLNAWLFKGKGFVHYFTNDVYYGSPYYASQYSPYYTKITLRTEFMYFYIPYTVSFGTEAYYDMFGWSGHDMSFFVGGVFQFPGFRHIGNKYSYLKVRVDPWTWVNTDFSSYYINETATEYVNRYINVNYTGHGQFLSDQNSTINLKSITVGQSSIWRGLYYYGYVRYGFIWFGEYFDETNITQIESYHIAIAPDRFYDPTFFNGTYYFDLFDQTIYGVPREYGTWAYNPNVVDRVPDTNIWLWVVDDSASDGLVHFKYLPYGSIIRLYTTAGSLKYVFVVTGQVNGAGLVEDYAVSIASDTYRIEVLIPSWHDSSVDDALSSVGYGGSRDGHALQVSTAVGNSVNYDGKVAVGFAPYVYGLNSNSPPYSPPYKAYKSYRVWGIADGKYGVHDPGLGVVFDTRFNATSNWILGFGLLNETNHVFTGEIPVALLGLDGEIYLYYAPDNAYIDTGLNYTENKWTYIGLAFKPGGAIEVMVSNGLYPGIYDNIATYTYQTANWTSMTVAPFMGALTGLPGETHILYVDWFRARSTRVGDAQVTASGETHTPFHMYSYNITGSSTTPSKWTAFFDVREMSGFKIVIPGVQHTWILEYNNIGDVVGSLGQALLPFQVTNTITLYYENNTVLVNATPIPANTTLTLGYDTGLLTLGYYDESGVYHQVLSYNTGDTLLGVAQVIGLAYNFTFTPVYTINTTLGYNLVATISPTIVPASGSKGVVLIGYKYETTINVTTNTTVPYRVEFGLLVNGTQIYNYVNDNGTVQALPLGLAKTPMVVGVGYDYDNASNTLSVYSFYVWTEEKGGATYTYWKKGYLDYVTMEPIPMATPIIQSSNSTIMIDRFGLTLGWAMSQYIHDTARLVVSGPFQVGGLVKYVTITGPIVVKLSGGSITIEPAPVSSASTITLQGFKGWSLNLALYGANVNGITITSDSYPVDFPTGFSAVIVADLSSRSISIVSAEAPSLVHGGSIPTGTHIAIPNVVTPKFKTIMDAPTVFNMMLLGIGILATAIASGRLTGDFIDGVVVAGFVGGIILLIAGDYINMSIAIAFVFVALAYKVRKQ